MKPKTEMISLIFLFIVFKEGFIQNVADGCADTQFGKVQKTQEIVQCTYQPIKSAPNASRKIFLEKNDRAKLRT